MSAFQWSDAWILVAVGLVSGAGPPTLAAVICAADGIQHAIPTREELDGAIHRLAGAGYLVHFADGLKLTREGRALLVRVKRSGRTHGAQQKAAERLLAAEPWSARYDPRHARGDAAEVLTREEYDAAVRAYYAKAGF